MNMHRIVVLLAAAAITAFAHSLAAQDKPEADRAENISPPAVSDQEIIVDAAVEETRAPEQVIVQTEEKFLSEMKVYPSF